MLTQRLTHFTLFIILTFFISPLHSQELQSIKKNATKLESGSTPLSGYYLLRPEMKLTEKSHIQLVKRLAGSDLVVAFLPENADLKGLTASEIYVLVNDDWKLAPGTRISAGKDLYMVKALNREKFIREYKEAILSSYSSHFVISLIPSALEQLKKDENVTYIQNYQFPATESSVIGHDLTVNNIKFTTDQFPEIRGNRIKISVKEELFDTTDIDLKNRYELFGAEAETFSQHATTIATLIAGAGNSSWRGEGVAPAASLSSSSYLDLLPDENTYFQNHGIFIQNHSYGTAIEQFYGVEAAAFDESVREVGNLLHVFSSGNSGNEMAEDDRYAGLEGYANLTGNFKMAKNILTVGAIDAEKNVISRSSKGPAFDGRIKPELVAYATTGTSDAAALVSGSAALLQEMYKDQNGKFPSASLLKALFIAGAEDVGRENIDFETGYGNLDTYTSLNILQAGNIAEGKINSEEVQKQSISIPEGTAEVKLVLAWTDPPANPGDEIALMNDLDLRLEKNGQTWLPWVLDSRADLQYIRSVAQRKRDSLNPVEVISIKAPQAGDYEISITAPANLSGVEQTYSLAWNITGQDNFSWTFPSSTNPVIKEFRKAARWKSSFQETGKLEINLNNSGWQVLSKELDLEEESYELNLNEMAGTAVLRMSIGTKQYLSEEFVVAPALSPVVEINCEDEIGVSWPEIPGASSYILQNLGNYYLEDLKETTETSIKLSKSEIHSPYFAVVPVFGNLQGANGLAINYTEQGVGCYYSTFYALLMDEDSVEATLNLSTGLGLASVEFFRQNAGSTKLLESYPAPFEEMSLTLLDGDFPTGENFYYALITLQDGTTIETERIRIYIPDDSTFLIAPNPVEIGKELHILSKGDNLQFQVFDLSGRLLSEDSLIQFNDRLSLQFFARGIYIVRALRNDKVVGVKKLIVL